MADDDLQTMTRQELIDEAAKLREGIRAHRDTTEPDLCWHHPALWGLLPQRTDPVPVVPEWPQFLRGCVRYRESLETARPPTRHAPTRSPQRAEGRQCSAIA